MADTPDDSLGNNSALCFSLKEQEQTKEVEQEQISKEPRPIKDFPSITISNEELFSDKEAKPVCHCLLEACKLRNKYQDKYNTRNDNWINENRVQNETTDKLSTSTATYVPSKTPFYAFQMRDGVCSVYEISQQNIDLSDPEFAPPSLYQFIKDRDRIIRICADPKTKSFCYRRIKALELKYQFHRNLNGRLEESRTKAGDNADLWSILKVDNHIHLAAAMNASHLLRFINRKVEECGDDVVVEREEEQDDARDGKTSKRRKVTLRELMNEILPPGQKLTIDILDVQAEMDTYMRFDRFNSKYNPIGDSELRSVFLKTENYRNGQYFAELTNEILRKAESLDTIALELRISVYGSKGFSEWSRLAKWAEDNHVRSPMNRWLIQVPRIYHIHRSLGRVSSFGEMLENIFKPLFEVTVDPSKDPTLHTFLQYVVGFDSVDDESKLESPLKNISPDDWTNEENPPYAYYLFHMYANIVVLNQLRKIRGLNTFSFRPHCGESGPIEHLADAFLLANSINHGITLHSSPSLQYLYYMKQIGLSLSPICNNRLFTQYVNNPFPKFFSRGLNVTLSTDDPMQFHRTNEPLMEEYSVASQIWHLTTVDLSEIALNSVLQSGFDRAFKEKWLGEDYRLPGVKGNDQNKTNIPNMRIQYRYETLQKEWDIIDKILAGDQKEYDF